MVFRGVQIGEKPLSLFMKAANKLQECGGKTDDDDLWSFALDSSAYGSLLDRVKLLEAVEDVLHDLLESCGRKLRMMKVDSAKPHSGCGIRDLPDEILSSIFEFLVEDNDASEFLQSHSSGYLDPERRPRRDRSERVLTRVCSHFRFLALSTPTLWSHIESSMSSNDVTARLELSRNCLLTIVIDTVDWGGDELKQFVDLVTPHAHRWVSFFDYYDRIGRGIGNLQLPQLEYFHVGNDHSDDYRNWDMPKLRYINISGRIYGTPPGTFSAQTVRSLFVDDAMCNLAMINYLISVPNLTELRITIREAAAIDVFGIHGTLPRVRKMSLQTSDEEALLVLIGRLQMPELSTLDLDIRCREVWHMTQIQSFETYPSVNELNIKSAFTISNGYEGYNVAMDLSPLSVLFPETRRLNLLSCCSNFKYPDDAKLPPLLSCSVLVCDADDLYFLRRLVDGLKRNGRWEQFQFFQLKVKQVLSRCEVDDICTKEKVRWYE